MLRGDDVAQTALALSSLLFTSADVVVVATEDTAESLAAVRATATALGNTPAVARGSYIDPRVFRRYQRGQLLEASRSPAAALRDLVLR